MSEIYFKKRKLDSKNRFYSVKGKSSLGFFGFLKIAFKVFFDKKEPFIPHKNTVPVISLKKENLQSLDNGSVVRLGHSTLVFKLDNKLIMTDPVFSERASPFSFIGPKRFHQMPISLEELPFFDIVIISHNHYDHLDKNSIEKLKDKVGVFYTTYTAPKI